MLFPPHCQDKHTAAPRVPRVMGVTHDKFSHHVAIKYGTGKLKEAYALTESFGAVASEAPLLS